VQDQVRHCSCDGVFNVNSDIERYCWLCSHWYHVRCIKHAKFKNVPTVAEVLGFQPSFLSDEDTLHLLSMAPIERGGRFGVSGNGHLQLKIRTMVKAGQVLDSMDAEMDLAYVESVSVQFDYFYCPACGSPI
jgi:hypothetical protein